MFVQLIFGGRIVLATQYADIDDRAEHGSLADV